MKHIKSFEDFINESYNFNHSELDSLDEALISELRYMYNIFKDGVTNETTEMYESNLSDFFSNYMEHMDESSFLNEDEADDLKKDLEVRKQQELGDKGFFKKAISFLSWAAFPIKAPLELIKLVQKKMAIRKLLKTVTDGAKKEKLRAELNALDKAQVAAVADLRKARVTKKYANVYGDDVSAKFKVESFEFGRFENTLDVFEAAGKISADEKAKILKKAEDAGKAEGKAVEKQAEQIAKKMAEADPSKRKAAEDKMTAEIEKKKAAWEEVKKKADAAGIKI